MAENTTNYQCPACTGPLRFDSASGKLCCDYCGSTYDVAQVEALYGEKQAQADTTTEAAEPAAPVFHQHRRIARARDLIKAYAREYGRVFRLCAYKNMAYAAHELIFKHGGHQRGKHILPAAALIHRNAP